ncbi:hypothetical protein ACRE_055470 [Hapsidospora chrysogenum ATCC 11550]|uniref:Uncharacterized protein n=1 Tax=Hapsidospora chrysogenum (strain ATCC 11550 / CBS 779.69 / DSM 880 / IAM 14645 / JCM 23072 / IMI 49137) TaxID=857340 RepID=A0A086T2W3_HAPC1|nr:hypothetical protein ACRE_055470 [Hapsidospora chrysogenum ATCC 11550]
MAPRAEEQLIKLCRSSSQDDRSGADGSLKFLLLHRPDQDSTDMARFRLLGKSASRDDNLGGF